MHNRKLTRLLRSLSHIELQEFQPFLLSPYFNTNKSVVSLFEFLKAAYPHFSKDQVKKELAYAHVHPKKKYNDSSFRNLVMALTNLVLEFLQQRELKRRKGLKDQLLLDAFSERMMHKEYEDYFQKCQKKLVASPPKSRCQFLEQYLVLNSYYHHTLTGRTSIDPRQASKTLESLDQFFVLAKLQFAIEVGSRASLLGESSPPFFFKKYIGQYIKTKSKNKQQLLVILQTLEQFYAVKSEKNITKANELFRTYHHTFSFFDQKFILSVLINQMNFLYQSGKVRYMLKMYELYKFGDEKGILIYNNSISAKEFLNIVLTATRSKKLNWAKYFIEKNIIHLPLSDKKVTTDLATALMAYESKDYHQVIKLLLPYHFKGSKLSIRFRLIIVKTHVELAFEDISKNLGTANNILENAKQYINREITKNNNHQRAGFLNCLKVVKLILKQLNRKHLRNPKQIRIQIENYTHIVAKNWLLQMTDQLK